MRNANVAVAISRAGTEIWRSFDCDECPNLLLDRPAGKRRAKIELPLHLLKPGLYSLAASIGVEGTGPLDRQLNSGIEFAIVAVDRDLGHSSLSPTRPGFLAVSARWDILKEAS